MPVKASGAWQEPFNEHFLAYHNVDPLWRKFEPFELTHNHRQGEGSSWVNTLNRIREGKHTEEDMEILKSRITKDKILDHDSTHVMYTNREVKAHNTAMLQKLDGEEVVLKAIKTPNKNVKICPKTGNIDTTQFQDVLTLKIGARVTVTFNVNTVDEIVNGATGKVLGFEKNKSGEVLAVVLKFDQDSTGAQQREDNKLISEKYKEQHGTPIFRQSFDYQKKSKRGKSTTFMANVNQFPLNLAYACTSHKMQVRKSLL